MGLRGLLQGLIPLLQLGRVWRYGGCGAMWGSGDWDEAAMGPHSPPAVGAGLEVQGLWGYGGVRMRMLMRRPHPPPIAGVVLQVWGDQGYGGVRKGQGARMGLL